MNKSTVNITLKPIKVNRQMRSNTTQNNDHSFLIWKRLALLKFSRVKESIKISIFLIKWKTSSFNTALCVLSAKCFASFLVV